MDADQIFKKNENRDRLVIKTQFFVIRQLGVGGAVLFLKHQSIWAGVFRPKIAKTKTVICRLSTDGGTSCESHSERTRINLVSVDL